VRLEGAGREHPAVGLHGHELGGADPVTLSPVTGCSLPSLVTLVFQARIASRPSAFMDAWNFHVPNLVPPQCFAVVRVVKPPRWLRRTGRVHPAADAVAVAVAATASASMVATAIRRRRNARGLLVRRTVAPG
jgi:hypothetical protein